MSQAIVSLTPAHRRTRRSRYTGPLVTAAVVVLLAAAVAVTGILANSNSVTSSRGTNTSAKLSAASQATYDAVNKPCTYPQQQQPISEPTQSVGDGVAAAVAAGKIGVGHCGVVVGTIPYPVNFDAYANQLVPVTSLDGSAVVGYEYPRIGFVDKAVVDAPGFDIADLQAIAAERAANGPNG